jgi:exodeoxyribonuclease VII large subunit
MTKSELQIITVTKLTYDLKNTLEGIKTPWITGEISSIKPSSGHLYLKLSDEENTTLINLVIWRNNLTRIKYQPKLGDKVLVFGSLTLYAKQSYYQINVAQILPQGEGLQALLYQQLKASLAAEGLFDPSRKRPLPSHPQTIAVVTSPTAAAWGDLQKTLNQRYPSLLVLLSPAIVQGDQAPESIVSAISRVIDDGRAEVLILTRGGGATEDLSCFNDEEIVRAIASCPIPVITGIGHERDESLADLAADYCAHTPTAVAEKVVPSLNQLLLEHKLRYQKLTQVCQRKLIREIDLLGSLKQRLLNLPRTSRSLQEANFKTQLLREKLAVLNPNSVLKRGYGVVTLTDGSLVNSVENLQTDQELIINLQDGFVKVRILPNSSPRG